MNKVIHHIEYMPTGEQFLEQRDYWHTPYRFNGKELDEETGYYYYGARYYTPEIGIWLSVDPLSDKYPSTSSFAYCLNNPVKLIDPNGMEVEAANKESQKNIRNTLTKDEARFVRFNKNGQLDTKRLNKSKSTSENMVALKDLANSETKYVFSTASEYSSKEKSELLVGDNCNGTKGVTLIPGAEVDPSPDNKVHIITSNKLSAEKQASNTAHEGYAHAYFYELQQQGHDVNPFHDYQSVLLGTEWNSEFNINVPILGRDDKNEKLVKQIKTVEDQAIRNFRSRRKNR